MEKFSFLPLHVFIANIIPDGPFSQNRHIKRSNNSCSKPISLAFVYNFSYCHSANEILFLNIKLTRDCNTEIVTRSLFLTSNPNLKSFSLQGFYVKKYSMKSLNISFLSYILTFSLFKYPKITLLYSA